METDRLLTDINNQLGLASIMTAPTAGNAINTGLAATGELAYKMTHCGLALLHCHRRS